MSRLARPIGISHQRPLLLELAVQGTSSPSPSRSISGTRDRARNLVCTSQGWPCSQAFHDSTQVHRRGTSRHSTTSRSPHRPPPIQSHPPRSLVAAYSTTPSRHASSSTSSPSQRPSPATLSQERYHELSDIYIDSLLLQLETLAEEREDVEVEYAAGVLTLTIEERGTYVLNKQPPNKQIWLSSPISGPKRYDYVAGELEGEGVGQWVYLRDWSSLDSLLEEEIGVKIGDVVSVD